MLDFNCLIVRDEKKGNVKEEINPVSRKQNHLTDPGERERERKINDRLNILMYISKKNARTLFFCYVLLSIIA